MERATIFVQGRVQGVGFRWWVRARALELGLTGSPATWWTAGWRSARRATLRRWARFGRCWRSSPVRPGDRGR